MRRFFTFVLSEPNVINAAASVDNDDDDKKLFRSMDENMRRNTSATAL